MRIALVALFAAMAIVAVWGWAAPSTGRFSVRVGAPPGLDGTVGKATGLLMWIGLGAVVLTGSLLAESDGQWFAVAGIPLLAFLLLMEFLSVRRATR